jgi:hypothetical protein
MATICMFCTACRTLILTIRSPPAHSRVDSRAVNFDMKKFVVIAASAFVAAPALAADVGILRPVPGTEYHGYYKGPLRPLAVSWTGCYLGGHVGGAIANYDETNGSFVVPVTIPPGFGPVPPSSSVAFDLRSVHLSSGAA